MVTQEVVLFLPPQVAPLPTPEKPKTGTETNSPAVKLLTGPSLAFLTGPRSFSTYMYSSFRQLFFALLSLCVFLVPNYFEIFKKWPFSKRGCKIWVFQFSVF